MGHQRLLRLTEVRRLTGLSRSTIYNRASLGTFPQRVSIGERAVAWIESEIHAWISGQIANSRSSV
jgi:prophage regulatory protein